ncbi:sodium:calcium antiporter [Rhodohalobacter barkolensis]|uniref:Sodium:calcium antiporter n=1 Tax=Rhodohalobacter barkolensis TaxID=2053187 RepID=A0A2N0VIM1_9BACT|nr:sodium:calcium antiporter [Rhodohalobacter barkolensis]
MRLELLLFILGLVFLIFGAEILVNGASKIAATVGLSPLIIGLTVVAFGTSSPELSVSLKSLLSGQVDVAAGNVIGSNIFNVLFILGLSALITPLIITQKLIRFDVPIMVILSVAVWLFSLNGSISQLEGGILFIALLIYIFILIYKGKKDQTEDTSDYSEGGSRFKLLLKNGIFVILGLVLLVYGSRWFVDGAVTLARHFGVSELVIGLTIVAMGTSLPEVFTSAVAAFRGERDIAVGNVVGSNIFNLLGVLGMTGLLSKTGMIVNSSAISFDIPVMIFAALLCLPIFFSGKIISRKEGGVMLGLYVLYIVYLIY